MSYDRGHGEITSGNNKEGSKVKAQGLLCAFKLIPLQTHKAKENEVNIFQS